MKKLSILAFLLLSSLSFGANHYVNSAATGAGTGVDWTNACVAFTGSCAPSTYTRGDVIYVADGSYASVNFNKAVSGTTLITIKKAIPSDHGTSTGWVDTMGDGQAAFTGQVNFGTSYWLMDGQVGGGPGDWTGTPIAFGFKISISSADPNLRTDQVSNITVRHIELQGTNNTSGGGSIAQDSVGLYGATNFTISYYYAHDAGRCIFFISTQNFLAEYGYTARYNSTSAAHAELASIWGFTIGSNGVVFRYSIFTHIEGTGGLIFDNEENTAGAGMQVYGNVFYKPAGDTWTINNGVVGGWTGGNGEKFFHVSVYNNSFVNANDSGGFSPLTDFPASGNYGSNAASNNLFYNSNAVDYSRWATNLTNTATATNPFTNATNLDFTLTGETAAGTALASPYNADYNGNARPGPDSVWSRGALQFQGAAPSGSVNNYWVSTSGSGTACTQAAPCGTINQALSTAVLGTGGTANFGSPVWLTVTGCGAAIHVLPGSYAAQVNTVKNGGATTQICLVSETQSTPQVSGAKIVNNNIQLMNSFYTIAGFDMTNPATSCTTSSGCTIYAINLGGANNHILYNYLHDFVVNGCAQTGVINPTGGGGDDWIIGNIIRHAASYNATGNTTHCTVYHGIYDSGPRHLIENNIISGITGWGIKSDCTYPAVITGNTVFNNGGGLNLTNQTGSGSPCGNDFDYSTISNNIIVNNGTDVPGGGRFGIDFYHVGLPGPPVTGTHNLVTNNLIYGNNPSDLSHHGTSCGTSASGTTPASGPPISGSDANGSAGGCPAGTSFTDAGGVTTTFTNFQVDSNSAPAANYNPANYQLGPNSNARSNGTTNCAASPPGVAPCTSLTDFKQSAQTTPPSMGAFAVASAPAGSITFLPATLTFPNTTVGQCSAPQASTVANNGSVPVTVSSSSIIGTNAGDYPFGGIGSCHEPVTLQPTQTCTESAKFCPTATGTRTGNIQIVDTAVGSPHSVALTGVSGAPVVSLSVTTMAFGTIQLGATSAIQSSILTNTGTGSLSITSIGLTGTDATQFTQSNNCGAAVAAGSNCTIQVTFKPTTLGAKSASISITDNAAGSPQTITLSGTGAGTAQPQMNPTSLTFTGQVVGTTSSSQLVTLTNNGNAPLTINSIVTSGDYAQTNNCLPGPLGALASCNINVTFTPAVAGSRTGSLVANTNAPSSPTTAALSGTGTQGAISLAPTSLTFPGQNVGTTSGNGIITITNTGTAAVHLSSVALAGTSPGDYGLVSSCGVSLSAGANCMATITFTPTATGSRTATLSVTDDAPGSPQTAPLTGTGTAPAVTLAPASVAFGNQITGSISAATNVMLSNTGTGLLTISSISLTGTNASEFTQSGNCGATLAAGTNCTISVRFAPVTVGSKSASLTVTDDAAGSPHLTTLTGTGIAGTPVAVLTPSSLTYPSTILGIASASQSATLQNTGTADLHITSIGVTGDYSQTNNCASPIVAPTSCTIMVTFTPTVVGTRTGTLSVTDDAAGSPQTVALSGIGATSGGGGGIAVISPSSLTFTSQVVGTSSAIQVLTLKNTDTVSMTVNSVDFTGNPTDYSETDNCKPTLGASASCTVNVTFTPTTTGARPANVRFSDSAAGSPQLIPITGTGIAPFGVVNVVPTSLNFGSIQSGSPTAAQTIVVKNVGTATLHISGITKTGTNTGDYALTNPCGATLAISATCTLSIVFTPGSTGTRTANISIASDDPNSPTIVPMTGVGTPAPAPKVSLSATFLTFPLTQVGNTTPTQNVIVSNIGDAALTISGITLGTPNATDYVLTNPCGTSIAAGANCTLQVAFRPIAGGTRTSSVSIADNATDTPQVVSLTGNAFVGTPTADLSTATITFTNQIILTTSVQRAIILTNNGNAALAITSVIASSDLSPGSSEFVQTNNCGTSVQAGASCTTNVTFTPQATGARTGKVTFTDNAVGGSQSVILIGTGINPPPPPGNSASGIGGLAGIGGNAGQGVH